MTRYHLRVLSCSPRSMLFNSFDFAVFFPIVTLLYFVLRGMPRIYWLLAASFAFYAAFIPFYTLILIVVILIDYASGLLMAATENPRLRPVYLALSLIANLGILCSFKYFNFITSNLAAVLHWTPWMLTWALPLGLSFHTFQSMAYTIEVYKGHYVAERSLPHLALYIMFYPQLVAGPIERPSNLLRQLHIEHRFSYDDFRSGMQLMFWGLFKKAAIADRLSFLSDSIFSTSAALSGPLVTIGALAFSFQIYCDFSGYSDMAIGAARVMGFQLTANFRRPYFATSFQDFWRRWHISLSNWFRDYVYLPLGRGPTALIAVFLLSGLWHGANWTFLIWGAVHAVFRLAEWKFPRVQGRLPVFALVTFAWIFFRASSLAHAWNMTTALPYGWLSLTHPLAIMQGFGGPWNYLYSVLGVLIVLAVDWGLEQGWLRRNFEARPAWLRAVAYNAAVLSLYALWARDDQKFIYFQF